MIRSLFASLRARLVLLVFLALIPAFGLVLYGDSVQRRLATHNVQDDTLRLARFAASDQLRVIETAHQLLAALAQLPQVHDRNSTSCNIFMANLLKRYPLYTNLGAADLDGNIFCSGVPLQEPVNINDRTYFQRALQTNGFAVGEYQIGRVTGVPALNVGMPVLDETQKAQGVVYAAINLSWFNQLAADAQSPSGSVLAVIDRNRVVLARYPEPEKSIGTPFPETSILQVLNAGQIEATREAIGVDGVSRLYALVQLRDDAEIPIGDVIVSVPSQVAFAEVNQDLTRNLIGLGLVTLLALVAAWYFGDLFIVRRVKRLSAAAEKLSAGDLSARTGPSYGISELSNLARQFDTMAGALEQREAKRAESEAALHQWADIFQSTQVGFVVDGADDGSLGLMNPAFAEMHGYAIEELKGKSIHDLIPPDARSNDAEQMRILLDKGHHIFETRRVRKDGTVFPVLVDATVVKNERGDIVQRFASVQDISQLRRVEETEREQRLLAEALHDTAAALNSTLDFGEVLNRILDNVGRVVPHDAADIMLLESDMARPVGCRGYAERGVEEWLLAQRFPVAKFSRLREMLATGQSILIRDVRNYLAWVDLPETRWIRSLIGMPIRVRERVVGILNIISVTPDFFDETHLARIETFADQVAIALENARLLAESDQRANQFSALYDLARELAIQSDVPVLLQTIVDRAMVLLDAPCGFMYLYDTKRSDLELAVEKGFDVPIGTRVQLGEGMAGRVAQTRQPLRVDDHRNGSERSQRFSDSPLSAALQVPMLYAGELIGVLVVEEAGQTMRRFTEEDARLLSLFAAHAASAVHNARLLQEMSTRAEQLGLLYDAGLTLNRVLDPHEQQEFLFKIATKALHAERAEFFRYDAASNQLTAEMNLGYGDEKTRAEVSRLHFSLDEKVGMVSWVARHRVPLNVADVQTAPGWRSIDPEIRSGLWVPIQHEDELRGVLGVLSTRLNAFSPQDERLLVLFANQVATAMENARLFEALRKRSEELEALRLASLRVTSTLELTQVLEQIIAQSLKLVAANNAHIFLYDGVRLSFGAAIWADAIQRKPFEEPRENGVTYTVARTGVRVVVPDTGSHPLYADRSWLSGAIVSLPLRAGENVRGVMNVAFRHLHEFDDNELRVLELLADQATVALENARLFNETRRRADRLAALNRIASAANQTLSLDELLEVIYQEVTATFQTDAFFIALHDAARQELDYRIRVDEGTREPPQRRSVGTGLSSRVIASQKPLLVRDWEKEKDHLPQPMLWGTMKSPQSWLGVPMSIGNTVVGIIAIEAYTPEAYDEEDAHLLATIADQVAGVIQNVRLFEETRRRAERLAVLNRIGRAISQTLDLNELLQIIYQEITSVITVGAFYIALYDPVTNELDFRIRIDEGVREPPARAPLVSGLSERVVATKKPILVRDREHVKQFPTAALTLWGSMKRAVSWLGVPMMKGDTVVGIVSVQAYTPNVYGEEEERLLMTIADQVAVAVQNARLFDETLRRLNELEAVNKISIALRLAKTVEEMAPLLLDETLAAFKLTVGQIAFYDPATDALRVAAARGWFADTPTVAPANDGIAGQVFETGLPYVTREFKPDPATSELARAQIPDGWGGAVVPIRTGQEVTGVLDIATQLPREITQDEARLLTLIAEIAGTAIHRATLHEQTEQRLQRLDALHMIDTAIGASLDLRVTLNILLDQVITQLRVDAANVLLLNPYTQMLEYAAARGFHTNVIEHTHVRMGQEFAGRAAIERHVLFIPDLVAADGAVKYPELMASEPFASYCAAPLIAKGQIKGVLEIFHRSPLKPDSEWLDFVETLAGQTAIAVDNAALFDSLQRSNFDISLAYDATIEGWARSIDLRDPESRGRIQRVTELTLLLARALGMSDADMIHVRRGALLYHIGKMGIPDSVLFKRSPLTDEEEQVVRQHPAIANEILAPIAYLRPAMDIPYGHHEKWDGTGYPRGLQGEQIPLAARIFAVANAWDEIQQRPDRAVMSFDAAQQYMRERAGTLFDPRVVEALIKLLEGGNI